MLTDIIRNIINQVKADAVHPTKLQAQAKYPNSFNFVGLTGNDFIVAYYEQAKEKKIGYPDIFRNYVKGKINRNTFCDSSYRRLMNRVIAQEYNRIKLESLVND
jgi:hypothetical protein